MGGYRSPPTLESEIRAIHLKLSALERAGRAIYGEKLNELVVTAFNDTSGPTVNVNVPPTGMLHIFVACDIKMSPVGTGPTDAAELYARMVGGPTVGRIASSVSTVYQTWLSTAPGRDAAGSPDGWSGTNASLGTWLVATGLPPGGGEFTLAYLVPSGKTAYFKNRKLWVLPQR